MVGFDDVRLPETFSQGSMFGVRFDTRVIELESGASEKVQRYPDAGRRKFNLKRGIASIDDALSLKDFVIGRKGALNSFRVKDWTDYATTATRTTHRGGDVVVADDDYLMQVDPSSSVTYQCIVTYISGPTTVTRAITHLVSGTLLVALDGTPTTAYSVDLLTGVVTLDADPGGAVVTWGGQYDVPGSFTEDIDKAMEMIIEGVETGSIPDIIIDEDLQPVIFNQERDYGGQENHGAMGGADKPINLIDGMLQIFEPAVTGLKASMPDTVNLPFGGPLVVIRNEGSQTLEVTDFAGTTLEAALAVNAQIEVYLGKNSSGLRTLYI